MNVSLSVSNILTKLSTLPVHRFLPESFHNKSPLKDSELFLQAQKSPHCRRHCAIQSGPILYQLKIKAEAFKRFWAHLIAYSSATAEPLMSSRPQQRFLTKVQPNHCCLIILKKTAQTTFLKLFIYF